MTVVTKFPQSVAGNYTNPTNAFADDGANATVVCPSNTTKTFTLYDWGFAIPAGSTINSVTITYEHALDVPGYCEYWVNSQKNQANVGTQIYEMRTSGFGLTTVNKTANGTWTTDELNTGGLSGLSVHFNMFGYYFGSGFTHYVDYVSATVDYTAPASNPRRFAQII